MPALRLRLRTTCVTCGHPVPLSSARLDVACAICDTPTRLTSGAFGWIVQEGMDWRKPGEGALVLGEAEPSRVQCAACRSPVEDDAIRDGLARGDVACRCGRAIAVRAIPPALDSARFWSALVDESGPEEIAPSAEPVSFTCPNCGGDLVVDGTTRTPPCRHCTKRAYLPDDLWRALRPTPRAEPFYLWVDPAWYQLWTDGKRAAFRRALVAAILTLLGIAVAAALILPQMQGGPAPWEAALFTISFSWMPAWIVAYVVYKRPGPKRPPQ